AGVEPPAGQPAHRIGASQVDAKRGGPGQMSRPRVRDPRPNPGSGPRVSPPQEVTSATVEPFADRITPKCRHAHTLPAVTESMMRHKPAKERVDLGRFARFLAGHQPARGRDPPCRHAAPWNSSS